ncbi:hypothetical protein A6J80_09680 [Paracoccus yeei]|uniref:Uncharacterized protein n=1 Tax=Paracoccus yeei TaxID=147645 RepID=A0A1V0GS30_9RHOB|nr:hypothetical protein A6J80_09680 [Paracoccus yeei]
MNGPAFKECLQLVQAFFQDFQAFEAMKFFNHACDGAGFTFGKIAMFEVIADSLGSRVDFQRASSRQDAI